MNHKRGVNEKFIATDLPKAVAGELDRGALVDQSRAAAELKEVAAQIKQTLGPDALDADGRLAGTYHGTPLGKKHLALQAQAAGGRGREALEAAIFNHIGGNKYRLVSRIRYDYQLVNVRAVLTHPEYDEGQWKE